MKLFSNLGKKIRNLSFFSFSLALHLLLLFTLGGVVMFKAAQQQTAFQSPEVGSFITPEEELSAPEAAETRPAEFEEPATTAPANLQESPLTQASALSSLTESGFQVVSTSSPQLSGALLSSSAGFIQEQVASPRESEAPRLSSELKSMATYFGTKGESADALVGYLFDLKQSPNRQDTDLAEDTREDRKAGSFVEAEKGRNQKYVGVLNEFLKRWDDSVFDKSYRSKTPLSAYQIFMPLMPADEAPKAFDLERQVKPKRWVIHYRGNFVAPKNGTFRFVGMADDVLVVRFAKDIVLNGSLTALDVKVERTVVDRPPRTPKSGSIAGQRLIAGPWIRMIENRAYPMDVLLGELPGGRFFAFLLIEEKGENYEQRPDEVGPVLPVFQMAPAKVPKFEPEQTGPVVAREAFSGKGNGVGSDKTF